MLGCFPINFLVLSVVHQGTAFPIFWTFLPNLTVESSRLFRPVWKVSNFQAIENKEIRSMGDARISILEVLKNQILRRTFDCQVPKKGSSNTEERIELLNRFIAHFGTLKIDSLLAEREFIGKEWFGYLKRHHIPFHIRIKRDMKIARTNGRFSPASNFFRSLPLSTFCTLYGPSVDL
jgi:hypothetical protein